MFVLVWKKTIKLSRSFLASKSRKAAKRLFTIIYYDFVAEWAKGHSVKSDPLFGKIGHIEISKSAVGLVS
jgi:hypothetical protein